MICKLKIAQIGKEQKPYMAVEDIIYVLRRSDPEELATQLEEWLRTDSKDAGSL